MDCVKLLIHIADHLELRAYHSKLFSIEWHNLNEAQKTLWTHIRKNCGWRVAYLVR